MDTKSNPSAQVPRSEVSSSARFILEPAGSKPEQRSHQSSKPKIRPNKSFQTNSRPVRPNPHPLARPRRINKDYDSDENVAVVVEELMTDTENEAYIKEHYPPTGNVAVVPPRALAFQAPAYCLPCPRVCFPACAESDEGVNFCFFPRADHATAMTFCCHPRKKPTWHTMMRCGFVPVINTSLPPGSCLPEGNGVEESSSEDSSTEKSSKSTGKSKRKTRKALKNAGKGDRSSKGSKSSATTGPPAGSLTTASTRSTLRPPVSSTATASRRQQPKKSILKKKQEENTVSSSSASSSTTYRTF